MNILIFSWRGVGHPEQGGAEISTHEHAKRWVRDGHQVTLFTSFYQGAKRNEAIDGVDIIRRGNQFLGVHLQAWKWYLFEEHNDFDLVIDQFHGIPFFTPLYVRKKKMGFIHEIAGEVWGLNQLLFPFNLAVGILGKISEPLIFKLYKRIYFMTVSESTKKDLIKMGISDSKIVVIHNGINCPTFKNPPKKENKKTLIFLGALTKDKGIDKALKAFSLINKSFKDWQFWIVGKSYSSLSNKIQTENIKFWGYVNEKKKYELLSRAHLLINPSFHEGWGLVVIEAASVGTPTVAFNVAGLRNSVIDNKTGLLTKEQTAEGLMKSAVSLLENRKTYEKMCSQAIIWSRNFTWDKASKASLDLIKRVTG